MKKNKNLYIILAIVVFFIAFIVMSFMISDNINYVEPEKPVTFEEWHKETLKDQYVVTVLGSSTCPRCQEYKPVLKKLAKKYNFVSYFFEGDKMDTEFYDNIMSSYEGLEHEYVPFTIITKNGEVVTTRIGFNDEATITEFYKEIGVIKN